MSEAETVLDEEEQHGEHQRRQQVDGLAVLDVQHAESGGGNQDATHERNLADKFFGNECLQTVEGISRESYESGDILHVILVSRYFYHRDSPGLQYRAGFNPSLHLGLYDNIRSLNRFLSGSGYIIVIISQHMFIVAFED